MAAIKLKEAFAKILFKQHEGAKDEGLTKALKAFEHADSKDPEALSKALEDLVSAAEATKKKNSKVKEISDYCEAVVKEGKKSLKEAEAALKKQEQAKDNQEDERYDENWTEKQAQQLLKVMRVVKTKRLPEGNPMLPGQGGRAFVLCIGGKRKAALIVAPKPSMKRVPPTLKKACKKATSPPGGTPGKKFITGIVYGGPKYTFCLESKPPGGLTKMIKRATLWQLKGLMKITGVILRGGGEELDDENDEAEFDETLIQDTSDEELEQEVDEPEDQFDPNEEDEQVEDVTDQTGDVEDTQSDETEETEESDQTEETETEQTEVDEKDNSKAKEAYEKLLESLQGDIDEILAAKPSQEQQVKVLYQSAQGLAKNDDFETAQKVLKELQGVLGAANRECQKTLNERFKAVQSDLKQVLGVNDDRMPDPTERIDAYRKAKAARLWQAANASLTELEKDIARAKKHVNGQRDEITSQYERLKSKLEKVKTAVPNDVPLLNQLEQLLLKYIDKSDFISGRQALARLSQMVATSLDTVGVDSEEAERIKTAMDKIWDSIKDKFAQAAGIETYGFWPKPKALKSDYDIQADAGQWYSAERSMTGLQTLVDKIINWNDKLKQRVTKEQTRLGKFAEEARKRDSDNEELQGLLQDIEDAIEVEENYLLASQKLVELRKVVVGILKQGRGTTGSETGTQQGQQDVDKLKQEVQDGYKQHLAAHREAAPVQGNRPLPNIEADRTLLVKQLGKGQFREAKLILERWTNGIEKINKYAKEEESRFEKLLTESQDDFEKALTSPEVNPSMLRRFREMLPKLVEKKDFSTAQRTWLSLDRLVTGAIDSLEPLSGETAKAQFEEAWNDKAKKDFNAACAITHPDTWPAPKSLKAEFDQFLQKKQYRSATRALDRLNSVVQEILSWHKETETRLREQLKVAKTHYQRVRAKEIGDSSQEQLDEAYQFVVDQLKVQNDLLSAELALGELRKLIVDLDLNAKQIRTRLEKKFKDLELDKQSSSELDAKRKVFETQLSNDDFNAAEKTLEEMEELVSDMKKTVDV